MLSLENVWASIQGKEILKGLTLNVNAGEIHAIMGPNGAGKSTLAKILAGHPDYEVTRGTISFLGTDLLEKAPEERAQAGLFMSFQYPPEIGGLSNLQFLLHALNAKRKASQLPALSKEEFDVILEEKMKLVEMNPSFKDRNINEGFSGGEKKRNEIVQLGVLDPKFAVLDETDSGLDIDALRIVGSGVTQLMTPEKALIVITHYQRLLDYLRPTHVHVLVDGKIIQSGDFSLAAQLERKGYEWLTQSELVG